MPVDTPPASKKKKRKTSAPTVSRLHKPEEMSLEAWQRALRRQFGREQKFKLENVGQHPVFSDFLVTNPQSKRTYRVSIRGGGVADNFCTCPDFSINALGTCKHIEFTLGRLEHQRGGKTLLRQGFKPPFSELVLQYGARREVRFRPGTTCPRELLNLSRAYFDSAGILRPKALDRVDVFLSRAGAMGHELRCYDDALAFIAEARDRQRRQQIIDRAFSNGGRATALARLLKVRMYPYQTDGAIFAARAGRCLIADEMGLGKTIQAIAAAEIMARHFGVERVLIVCPTSLKHQWSREIARFVDRPAAVVGGMRLQREIIFRQPGFYKITNYDTVHRDLDLIAAWAPDLVILDEAQRIKNWKTRAARSVKQIASPYAIVLTGTPLENRLEELVSIVEFVDRHRLGPTYRFLADHQVLNEVGRVVGYRDLDRIGKTLAPIMIRRHKDQVLKQLPPRLDKHLFVPMTPQQMLHHDENRDVVARIVHKWRRYRFLSEADQRRLMIALQNMRMSCDSTYLLDQTTDFGVKADELATLIEEILEQPDAKVVIFSQWLRMHEVLQRRLTRKPWDHVLFHGGVPTPKRKGLVDRFRDDPRCRAFLATDAGGVGLNLQHASTVINMDLPWNPAILEQRIGRVHRLGQTAPVRVVNFVAQGTIEEGMLSVIRFKKSLFAGALDAGEREVSLGGTRLDRFIKGVEQATGSIPTAAVQQESDRQDAAESRDEAPLPDPSSTTTGVAAQLPTDPWAGLLQTGLTVLEQLATAARGGPAVVSPSGLSVVQRDPATGESYFRLPMPSADTLDRVLRAVGTLLERFRK